MPTTRELITNLTTGDKRALARCITIVENELDGYDELLQEIKPDNTIPVIGITGAPGAGKSSLINSLLKRLSEQNKKVAVIAVDPTSPFTQGSILGDRIRMEEHFTSENIFIRSLATRGSLGGLSAKTIEVLDVMRAAVFDYILIETVGVGQSEVEIMGIADTTVLILVPEGGDEVQTIKSGIMEIADIYVVNKSDRDGADKFVKNIHQLLHERAEKKWQPPVIKAVATTHVGTDELISKIIEHNTIKSNARKIFLLAEKAYRLIQNEKMKAVNKEELKNKIEAQLNNNKEFNLYQFIKQSEKVAFENIDLQKAHDDLEEKNKDIASSMKYAGYLQTANYPSREKIKSTFLSSFFLVHSKDSVSGDIFWVSKFENKSFVAAVDCTGHGVPGALLTMIANELLNTAVESYKIHKPGDVLNCLNAAIKKKFSEGYVNENKIINDGMDIAFCSLDYDSLILEYAGANRPLLIVRNGEILETPPTKYSIGGHTPPDQIFENHVIKLQKGDSFYLFSDGYADQFGMSEDDWKIMKETGVERKRKKIMMKNFKKLLIEVSSLGSDEQGIRLLDDYFKKWRGDEPQTDDVLIIGINV